MDVLSSEQTEEQRQQQGALASVETSVGKR